MDLNKRWLDEQITEKKAFLNVCFSLQSYIKTFLSEQRIFSQLDSSSRILNYRIIRVSCCISSDERGKIEIKAEKEKKGNFNSF